MRTYSGAKINGAWSVVIKGPGYDETEDLDPRLDLRNHSPTGFAWGYGGSGPAQLSLALLAHALGDDERALRLYQDFKFKVIGGLPQDEPWEMSDTVVRRLAEMIERETRASSMATATGIGP